MTHHWRDKAASAELVVNRDIADRAALALIVAFIAWGVCVCAVGLYGNLTGGVQ